MISLYKSLKGKLFRVQVLIPTIVDLCSRTNKDLAEWGGGMTRIKVRSTGSGVAFGQTA